MRNFTTMIENNFNSNCNQSEQLISFLYREIDGAEKSKFEFHLQNCPTCAEELSGFSAVRTSVLEWRSEEFEKLLTPAIEIPQKTVDFKNSNSWLKSIKGFFALNPVGFSAAAAAILLAFSLIWLFSNRSSQTELAANINSQKNAAAPLANTLEYQKPIKSEVVAGIENDSQNVSIDKNESKAVSVKKVIQVKNAARNDTVQTHTYKVKKSSSSPSSSDKSLKQQPRKSVNNEEIPTMAIDEYKDNSLRLSDILEEVSMK